MSQTSSATNAGSDRLEELFNSAETLFYKRKRVFVNLAWPLLETPTQQAASWQWVSRAELTDRSFEVTSLMGRHGNGEPRLRIKMLDGTYSLQHRTLSNPLKEN